MRHDPAFYNEGDTTHFPGLLGIHCVELGESHAIMEMPVEEKHMNLMGSIHGGAIVTLADTAAGYGTHTTRPSEASGFTTLELKSNFIRPATGGVLQCRADCIHRGRTTQIWDATVVQKETGRTVAEFRCTQMILSPRD